MTLASIAMGALGIGLLLYLAGRRAATGRRTREMDQVVTNLEQARATLEESERAARLSETQHRALVDHAPFGIFRCDPADGRVLSANPTLVEALGYTSAEQLVGKLLPSEIYDRESDWLELQRSLSRGTSPLAEVTWLRRDGAPVRMRTRFGWAEDAPNGEGTLVGFVEDVTERQELEDRLRQAQKMEAVGQLAAGVAHDFNNLLTVILGSSEFLLEDLEEHHTWMLEEVLEIQKAGRKASSLTHQLLAFSRKQPLAPEVLDLNEVVREAFELLRRTVGEDVEIETGLRPDCGSCVADPHQLQQVLLNLVVNARDAMPTGGVITIATGRTTFDAHSVRRKPGSTPGTYVTIAVSDTGTGMSEATKARLFEPFFTTKEVGVGTGLGLATAYGIVKQSNGYIDVESELGEGSTFTVCLPLTRQAVGQSKLQPASARRGGNETILLAEDEEPVRLLARKVLERAGYQVLEARDGSEAAHMADAFPGQIHAVVTDVVMPKRSGRELVEDLSRTGKEVRVLYMSGHADDAMQRHGVVEGRESFLRKPFTPDCLLTTLRKLLDGGTAGPVTRRCHAAARPGSLPSRVQDATRQSLMAKRLPDAFRTSNRQRSVT